VSGERPAGDSPVEASNESAGGPAPGRAEQEKVFHSPSLFPGPASRALDIGRQPTMSGPLEVAIMGTASGGLTCGAVPAKRRLPVILLEQQPKGRDIRLKTPA
jgi:hypothetical protein